MTHPLATAPPGMNSVATHALQKSASAKGPSAPSSPFGLPDEVPEEGVANGVSHAPVQVTPEAPPPPKAVNHVEFTTPDGGLKVRGLGPPAGSLHAA